MSSLYFTIQTLLEEYKDNPYLLSRIETHINQLLPETLKAEEKKYLERMERKQRLENEYTQFIKIFMLKHRYYYCPQSELFLEYNGEHFTGCSIDNILHKSLSTISSEKTLVPWKYRTNNDLISMIKQKSPLHEIPESPTIQSAIGYFYPAIFSLRNEAKYFLTIIGDCILGKRQSNLIYIISPHLKFIIQELEYNCSQHFGLRNVFQHFKYKFYDHDYKKCRLVPFKKKHFTIPIAVTMDMTKYMIDILCVCVHYSNRYGSADAFLDKSSEKTMVDYVKFLSRRTPEEIVDAFIKKSLDTCENGKITTKNMIFIWKKYLEELDMQSVIFHEQLKTIFKTKLSYHSDTDCYVNVTSKHLPVVSLFMEFWESTITTIDNENSHENLYEYEIDEITELFRSWIKKPHLELNDAIVLDLIKHFYQDIDIVDEKYVINIKSNIWDKRAEVINGINDYKIFCKKEPLHTVYSLYSAYERYTSQATHKMTVSKFYFEKVSRNIFGDLIDAYGIISKRWM